MDYSGSSLPRGLCGLFTDEVRLLVCRRLFEKSSCRDLTCPLHRDDFPKARTALIPEKSGRLGAVDAINLKKMLKRAQILGSNG